MIDKRAGRDPENDDDFQRWRTHVDSLLIEQRKEIDQQQRKIDELCNTLTMSKLGLKALMWLAVVGGGVAAIWAVVHGVSPK